METLNYNKRKKIRLQNYDYSQNGAYFVTICIKDKQHILGTIVENEDITSIVLSKIGKTIAAEIDKIPTIYSSVLVDPFVIMPNHIHMIIIIENDNERRTQFAPTNLPNISRIIKQFKGSITKQIGNNIWQKSYFDHVIRDEQDYQIRSKYIIDNPIKWIYDEYY